MWYTFYTWSTAILSNGLFCNNRPYQWFHPLKKKNPFKLNFKSKVSGKQSDKTVPIAPNSSQTFTWQSQMQIYIMPLAKDMVTTKFILQKVQICNFIHQTWSDMICNHLGQKTTPLNIHNTAPSAVWIYNCITWSNLYFYIHFLNVP